MLMYHALQAGGGDSKYTLTHRTFRAHLQMICDYGLRAVSVGRFLAGDQDGVVVLTFDDGNRSDAEFAWPMLLDHGFGATFYITCGHLGPGDGQLDWPALRDMARTGAEIGCHGRTHRFLDTTDRQVLESEVEEAKSMLEGGIGVEVSHFSLPGGRYCRETLRQCARSGFRSVATSVPGYRVRLGPHGLTLLDRFVIHQGHSAAHLAGLLRGNLLRAEMNRLSYQTKRMAKHLLGNRIYHLGWSAYMKGGRR